MNNIDVIITTKNRSDNLISAVNSVLKQTINNYSIFIVSDASTDNTIEVAERLKSEHDCIDFIQLEESLGANNARNIGLRNTSSKYICFLDDDDEWYPEKLEKQFTLMESKPKVGLVYTGINIIYPDYDINYYSCSGATGDLSKKILMGNLIGTTSNVMFERDLIDKAGLFDLEMPAKQDYDMWTRLCQYTEVGVINEPLVKYYNEISQKQISSSIEKHVKAMSLFYKKYKEYYSTLTVEELNIQKSNFYTSLANVAMRNGLKKDAFKFSFKAFKAKPSLKKMIILLLSTANFKMLLKLKSKT